VAVKIRLMRVGKKKQPTYRVVVADGRSPRDGRFIEIIGQYAPREEPSRVSIDADSALAWLRKGAQPTEQVQKLLATTGVWAQYEAERGKPAVTKLSRRGYMTGKVAPGVKAPKEAPAAEAPVAEAPVAEAPVAEAPVAEAPAAVAPADEAPTEDAVAEEPVAEAPAEDAPAPEEPTSDE
jgi:small subunit ribosomal protein S16